jgi:hypothetical protein
MRLGSSQLSSAQLSSASSRRNREAQPKPAIMSHQPPPPIRSAPAGPPPKSTSLTTANNTNATNPVIRFISPAGELVEMPCQVDYSISTLKDRLWSRKKWQTDHTKFLIRLLEGEVYFNDNTKLADILRIIKVFNQNNGLVELLVVPQENIGDKKQREAKQANHSSYVQASGYLFKLSKSGPMKSWKRRYFVLQDITLYYYDSEETFRAGGKAIEALPVGNIIPSKTSNITCSYNNQQFPHTLELNLDSVGKFRLNLAVETEGEYVEWLSKLEEVNFKRMKSIVVNICEELTARSNCLDIQGLFRLSGSKEIMENIKKSIDLGEFLAYHGISDENNLTGILKSTLREMHQPLLTFPLYREFISAGQAQNLQDKTNKSKAAIHHLPLSHKFIVDYLFNFLKQVSRKSEKNMMSANNLAIVFAPNLLKSSSENLATSMADNPASLAVIATLIEYYDAIFSKEETFVNSAPLPPLINSNNANFATSAINPARPPPPQRAPVLRPPPNRAHLLANKGENDGNNSAASQTLVETVQTVAEYYSNLKILIEKRESEAKSLLQSIQGDVQAARSIDLNSFQSTIEQFLSREQSIHRKFESKLVEQYQSLETLKKHYSLSIASLVADSPTHNNSISSSNNSVSTAINPSISSGDVRSFPPPKRAPSGSNLVLSNPAQSTPPTIVRSPRTSINQANSGPILSSPSIPLAVVPPPPIAEADLPGNELAVANFNYPGGTRKNDIVLAAGDELEVLEKDDKKGWWFGINRRTNEQGYFPGSYCVIKQN